MKKKESLTNKMAKKFFSTDHMERMVKALASADTYAHRCCADPVGMGIMKDNGDGTLSLIRPKEFTPDGS